MKKKQKADIEPEINNEPGTGTREDPLSTARFLPIFIYVQRAASAFETLLRWSNATSDNKKIASNLRQQ